jgi:hypothetical protein
VAEVIQAREWRVEDLRHTGRSTICSHVGQIFDLPVDFCRNNIFEFGP